jgi:hypothetical protein
MERKGLHHEFIALGMRTTGVKKKEKDHDAGKP